MKDIALRERNMNFETRANVLHKMV